MAKLKMITPSFYIFIVFWNFGLNFEKMDISIKLQYMVGVKAWAHSTKTRQISLPSPPPNIDEETIVGNLIELFIDPPHSSKRQRSSLHCSNFVSDTFRSCCEVCKLQYSPRGVFRWKNCQKGKITISGILQNWK